MGTGTDEFVADDAVVDELIVRRKALQGMVKASVP